LLDQEKVNLSKYFKKLKVLSTPITMEVIKTIFLKFSTQNFARYVLGILHSKLQHKEMKQTRFNTKMEFKNVKNF